MPTVLSAPLATLSLSTVALRDPLVFGASAAEDLAALRLLRDATSHAVRLRWVLAGEPTFDLRTHVHLVPPASGVDPAAQRYAMAWSAGYRYGSFYFREGPGFVSIKDVRPGGEASRLIIDEGATGFVALAREHTVADARARCGPGEVTDELLDAAVEAGLLIRVDDAVLVLPYRIRHWPVPYVAV